MLKKKKKKKKRLMQWGGAAAVPFDAEQPYPQTTWESESLELKQELTKKLEAQVKKLRAKVDEQRANAVVVGTQEYTHLQHLNSKVAAHNASIPRGQKKGRKQKMTPNRAYVYEEYSRDLSKGGLNFVWYAFEVY
jgi:hypothetical protein